MATADGTIEVRRVGGWMRWRFWAFRRRLSAHLRGALIGGLLLIIPVALTYLIVKFIFDIVDNILRPWIEWMLEQAGIDWSLPGPGIVAAIVLVYLAGVAISYRLGRVFLDWARLSVIRIPFVGTVYSATRQLVESFSGSGQTGLKRVVLVQFPKPNSWSVGFLTGVIDVSGVDKLLAVYVPTAPLPNSGFVVMTPAAEVMDTDLSVSDAMQIMFSGGVISPTKIKTTKIDMRLLLEQSATTSAAVSKYTEEVRERFLSSVTDSGYESDPPIEAIRRGAADAINIVTEAKIHSNRPAHDAVIGIVQALFKLKSEANPDLKDIFAETMQAVNDSDLETERFVMHAVTGSIQWSKELDGETERAYRAVAEAAIQTSPTIGLPLEDAIPQISQGVVSSAREFGIKLEDAVGASAKGVIFGALVLEKADVFAAARSVAYCFVTAAGQEEVDLGKVSRRILESVVEVAGPSGLDAQHLAHAVAGGAIEAGYEKNDVAGEVVEEALSGITGDIQIKVVKTTQRS